MNSKLLYYLLAVALGIISLMGVIAFVYVAFGELGELIPAPVKEILPQRTETPSISPVPVVQGPLAKLYIDEKGKLILSWKNLPKGTRDIQILRSKEGQPRPVLWKTISVSGLSEGFIQLQSSFSQNLFSYTYYFQAVGADGETVWTSSPDSIGTNQTEPATPPTVTGNTPPNQGNQTNQNTNPPPGTENNSASSSTPPPPTPPPATNTTIYYTPQGDISGSITITQEQFWVKDVNKRINIGWSNLNPASTEAVISRSISADGPWIVLFRQTNPIADRPYSIFILDEAVSQSHYYKLETFSSSGEILDRYGPVIFNPSGS